jgi:hypothetical protein
MRLQSHPKPRRAKAQEALHLGLRQAVLAEMDGNGLRLEPLEDQPQQAIGEA